MTHSDVHELRDAKHLGHLLPLRDVLLGWRDTHARADSIFDSFPQSLKSVIQHKEENTLDLDMALTIAQCPPLERRQRGEMIGELIEALEQIMDEDDVNPDRVNGDPTYSDADLDLIVFATELIKRVGSVSKREFDRLRDAIESNDNGYLIFQHLNVKGDRKARVDVKFTNSLPAVLLAELNLRQP